MFCLLDLHFLSVPLCCFFFFILGLFPFSNFSTSSSSLHVLFYFLSWSYLLIYTESDCRCDHSSGIFFILFYALTNLICIYFLIHFVRCLFYWYYYFSFLTIYSFLLLLRFINSWLLLLTSFLLCFFLSFLTDFLPFLFICFAILSSFS